MASIEQISELFDKKVNGIVDNLEGRIAKNEVRTEEAHTRIDGHSIRLENLEAKLASGASHSGFIAKCMYVKGICDFDIRKDKGMSRTRPRLSGRGFVASFRSLSNPNSATSISKAA